MSASALCERSPDLIFIANLAVSNWNTAHVVQRQTKKCTKIVVKLFTVPLKHVLGRQNKDGKEILEKQEVM